MTSPIKPPGGPPAGVPGPEDIQGPAKPADAKGPEKTFKATLDAAAPPEATSKVAPAEEIRALAEAIKAGEINSTQAVDKLVSRALESPTAKLLTGAGRASLEAKLRQAIKDDPALSGLVEELDS